MLNRKPYTANPVLAKQVACYAVSGTDLAPCYARCAVLRSRVHLGCMQYCAGSERTRAGHGRSGSRGVLITSKRCGSRAWPAHTHTHTHTHTPRQRERERASVSGSRAVWVTCAPRDLTASSSSASAAASLGSVHTHPDAVGRALAAYARAMRCPVLRCRTALAAYALFLVLSEAVQYCP
eukprot:1251530-Rhodomonas_salina.1